MADYEHYVAAVSASCAVTERLGGATSAGINKAGPMEVPTNPSCSTELRRTLCRRPVPTGLLDRHLR